jgi:hypothetical protein
VAVHHVDSHPYPPPSLPVLRSSQARAGGSQYTVLVGNFRTICVEHSSVDNDTGAEILLYDLTHKYLHAIVANKKVMAGTLSFYRVRHAIWINR